MDAEIKKISDNLFLIILFPPIPGFNNFIGAWLYKGDETFLVDVGPSVTVDNLAKALQDLNVRHLDFIFLTHIHVDHAGGTGDMAFRYPGATIICHRAGISHLVDPSHLSAGTIRTLGDIGRTYGPINPIPIERIIDAGQFKSDSVVSLNTPGHSIHHVSYLIKEYLFAGEAGGVHLSLPPGQDYLRPATPPRLLLDDYIESLDSLIARKPGIICYGHFGIKYDAVNMLNLHRKQLFLWKKIIADEIRNSKGEDCCERCMHKLLKEDHLLANFDRMDVTVKNRERLFLQNSIKGFIGYLKTVHHRPY